ncbi:hypothetical protein B0H10DRAFT_1991221 [Mycena sp. CBHHK59/15]|nr:hypothetical protein B0H10DRAFT_1991221 [Mycena sp. CBHHK59/15]
MRTPPKGAFHAVGGGSVLTRADTAVADESARLAHRALDDTRASSSTPPGRRPRRIWQAQDMPTCATSHRTGRDASTTVVRVPETESPSTRVRISTRPHWYVLWPCRAYPTAEAPRTTPGRRCTPSTRGRARCAHLTADSDAAQRMSAVHGRREIPSARCACPVSADPAQYPHDVDHGIRARATSSAPRWLRTSDATSAHPARRIYTHSAHMHAYPHRPLAGSA